MAEEDRNMERLRGQHKIDDSKASKIDQLLNDIYIPPAQDDEETPDDLNAPVFNKKPYRSKRRR